MTDPVIFTTDVNTELQRNIAGFKGRIFILTDSHTRHYCLPLISLSKTTFPGQVIEMQAGEDHKNAETCLMIWKHLAEYGADRHSLLICLGGGVVCDLGGFIASTYMRGIPFLYIPTTLLAMADASIGGKTGIDISNLKNLVGVFSQPREVLIDPVFLATLPERQLHNGYAEVLKIALVQDAGFWKKLNNIPVQEINSWNALIRHSVNLKKHVVGMDPRERGIRKCLNFGHTVGHALETLFLNQGRDILHGEAVAFGMLVESELSMRFCGLSAPEFQEIESYISANFSVPYLSEEDLESLQNLMVHDKKNYNGNLCFSLISEIGVPQWDVEISGQDLFSGLHSIKIG